MNTRQAWRARKAAEGTKVQYRYEPAAGAAMIAARVNAAREVLAQIFGNRHHSITLSTPALPGFVLQYNNLTQITDNVDVVRVHSGTHFPILADTCRGKNSALSEEAPPRHSLVIAGKRTSPFGVFNLSRRAGFMRFSSVLLFGCRGRLLWDESRER